MNSRTIIEIFHQGQWHEAASLEAYGPDRCRIDYLPAYQFSEAPKPLSLTYPLDTPPDALWDGGTLPDAVDRRPPGFLYDLVAQGKGRQYLVGLLHLEDADRQVMPLLMAGAFNPIGCLRLQSALRFYEQHSGQGHTPGGFKLDDILQKSEDFLAHLSAHAMLAAGTTGVQGVAPKYLMTQDQDGRWFADAALPDERANRHWLVKLPRGRSDEDRMVLRNEAAYWRVAQAVGLRTHAEPMLHQDMLFVPRFDRVLTAAGLERLHQESVASLAGVRGFGVPVTMNQMLAAIRQHVSDPLAETIEFLKRDVMNQALRNTDNHARNTAVQRLPNGRVQLTPVFDFAPMFKDPEWVPRSAHWMGPDGVTRHETWAEVMAGLEQVLPKSEWPLVCQALKDFVPWLAQLPTLARDRGVEKTLIDECRPSMERMARELSDLATWQAAQESPWTSD